MKVFTSSMRMFKLKRAALLFAIVLLASSASVACASPTTAGDKPRSFFGKIKHVIVLMLENRSFDHFFGFAKPFLNVEGLTGKEFNLVDLKNPSGKKVFVSDDAPYINECDPDHSTPATKQKIKNNMSGFVSYETGKRPLAKDNYCDVMKTFTPKTIPVISTLAKEFAIMDRFYCSHPGPTWPNRMFTLSGTSAGSTETGTWYHGNVGKLFPQKTIFDQVEDAGLEWRNYYNDTPWELFMESIAHSPENLKNLDQFFEDAKTGNLPSYAWINPRSGVNMTTHMGSQDQHPDHDVARGERYIKDIYEALRNSPQWNDTLFVLTYDEHGGFFDHMVPPENIPGPGDNEASYPDTGYNFTKLGIRVPTILVSPYIKKGVVISDPPEEQKPYTDSAYDLTSIMSTARKLLGMPLQNLTGRDGWSATFEHAISLPVPRTDCPIHLPDAPPPTLKAVEEGSLPLNDLQKDIAHVHAHVLSHLEHDSANVLRGMKQKHISQWLQDIYQNHSEQTMEWKWSKAAGKYKIVCKPERSKSFAEKSFVVNSNNSIAPFNTVSTMTLHKGILKKSPYCLDSGITQGGGAGSPVTLSLCYPSRHVGSNRDKDQRWLVEQDATIRSFQNKSLCVTNMDPNLEGSASEHQRVILDVCDGRVEQHWSYHTTPRDGEIPGEFYYGDDTNILGVVKN